jgi:hypothetical protein
MAEIQEIKDPLNEMQLILDAWALAHGIDAYVIVATRRIGDDKENSQNLSMHEGHPLLVEGLCRMYADKLEDIRRGLCEY